METLKEKIQKNLVKHAVDKDTNSGYNLHRTLIRAIGLEGIDKMVLVEAINEHIENGSSKHKVHEANVANQMQGKIYFVTWKTAINGF